MKQCNRCLQWKEEEEFNWRYKSLGVRHPCCKQCQRFYRRQWYEGSAKERHLGNVHERKVRVRKEAQEFLLEYLQTHPCKDCGETDPRVLEFHHTGERNMAISVMVNGGYSIENIMAEISKCVVLCANCHRKKTVEERGWLRGRK